MLPKRSDDVLRISRRWPIGAAGLAGFLLAGAAGAATNLLVAPQGELYYLAADETVRAREAAGSTERVLHVSDASAIALSRDGSRLFIAVPEQAGRHSRILALEAGTGQEVASRSLAGRIEGLLAIQDDEVVLAWGSLKAARKTGTRRGFAAKVPLGVDRKTEVIELAAAPEDGALSPDGSRLFLALPGSLQTLSVDAWTVSWSISSPGENHAVALVPAGGESRGRAGMTDGWVCAGKNEAVVCYDPSDRAARGVFPERLRIPTPAPVSDLVFPEGDLVDPRPSVGIAVMASAGTILRIDWREASQEALVEEMHLSQRLVGAALWADRTRLSLIAVTSDDAGAARVVVADAAAGPKARTIAATPPVKGPTSVVAEAPAPPAASSVEAPVKPHTPDAREPRPPPSTPQRESPPPQPKQQEPPLPPPPPRQAAPPEVPPAQPQISQSPPKEPASAPAPQQPKAETAPPATEVPIDPNSTPRLIPLPQPVTPTPATIAGSVGQLKGASVQVVAFGPNSLLREAARVKPGSDGRFLLEGLAPGTYRVLVRGESGASLNVDPPFYTVTMAPGGNSGVDFRLRTAGP